MSWTGSLTGAKDAGPSLGKLAQHQISNIFSEDADHPGRMEKQIAADKATMQDFQKTCG
jgi:hypothetical protein